MQKLSEDTNAINWFEIPVLDSARAKKFYETILDITMDTQHMAETNEELAFFPFTPGVIRATSGKVTGALVKSDHAKPSAMGTMVYLNANPVIQEVIERAAAAGGKVLVPKTAIKAGYISVIIDTEGNRIGLHSML
jgi:predicted enzyme related to lactoylglutathione lyase